MKTSAMVQPDALESLLAAVGTFAAQLAAQLVAEQHAPRSQAGEPLVDIDGLAAALRVSKSTVRRMKAKGMPVERYEGAERFDVTAVREWARQRQHIRPPETMPTSGAVLKKRTKRS